MDKISLITRSLAKKYTDDSVEGAGAIKGKNCQIQSIAPITGGSRVTFAWYDGEDVLKTGTMDVMDGVDGTDGQDGAKGDKGDKGDTGATGATGNGIASIEKTGTSGLIDTYTITMTNGDTATFTVTNGQDGTATDINAYHVDDTAETGLDDADYVPFYDTSATGMRKSLWSNIKSVLKTYFDTLYKGKNEASGGNKIYSKKPWHKCFKAKSWSGLTNFDGRYVWTDGENIYYSKGTSEQYVLNKTTNTWTPKVWNGTTDIWGDGIWTDGTNIYCTYEYLKNFQYVLIRYVLNKATNTWTEKSDWMSGMGYLKGAIWNDGNTIYSSRKDLGNNFVYNSNTCEFEEKTWTGLTTFYGKNVWTDGENIYYSENTDHYVLDKATSTWSAKTWTGLTSFNGEDIWTDGENIYYSNSTDHYILNKSTSTWQAKIWDGLTNYTGIDIWTDGEKIYYSSTTNQYVLSTISDFAVR